MRNKIVLTILAGILFFIFYTCESTSSLKQSDNPPTARGRPKIADGTLVSDRGTLLRGAYWSLDYKGELPDRNTLAEMKDCGLNALHVYAERYDSGLTPGVYKNQLDTIVRWCGEDGLYCVITIGGGTHNGQFDLTFATDFWKIYAPRYADMSWVVYEIFNEPFSWQAPYDSNTIIMEQAMYTLIRKHARKTPVLLFSYAGLNTVENILKDINSLDVDWSNALVAWHGYGILTKKDIRDMRAAGINSICTELPIGSHYSEFQVNAGNIDKCEENGISWLVFIQIEKNFLESWRFKKEIDKRGLAWEPDYGTWPGGVYHYTPAENLALNKEISVSSVENYRGEYQYGRYAVDGNSTTRWSSEFSEPQYLVIDLEEVTNFGRVTIEWESQYAREYKIQVSNDNENWTTLVHVTNGNGHLDVFFFPVTARYVRMYGIKRRGKYGFSLYEMAIYKEESY
ncbi:MAG: discoidin domain-containing protein [Spirochaetales bacterium]|nr:discoidin domain-containing protein [Spirochaetales bacterium]